MPPIGSSRSWLMPPWILGAVPLMATVLPKGMVVLLAVIGLPALVDAWRRRALGKVFPKWAVGIAVVALAWMVFRAAMPFNGEPTLESLGKYAALIVLGFGTVWWVRNIPQGGRASAGKALIVGALLSLAIAAVGAAAITLDVHKSVLPIVRADRYSIFNTGIIVLILLSPLVVVQMNRRTRKRWDVLYVAAVVALAFVLGASSAYMTAFAGIIVAVLCRKFGQQVTQLAAALSVAAIVVFPVALPLVLDRLDVEMSQHVGEDRIAKNVEFMGSLGHRYYIWRFALERAVERPFLGWGFDTSRSVPGGHTSIDYGKELMPLHPHNEILQVWLELGVPGLLILAAVVWYLFRPPHGTDRLLPETEWVRTATVTMILVVGSVSFGIWQSWWAASIILVLSSLYLCEKSSGDD